MKMQSGLWQNWNKILYWAMTQLKLKVASLRFNCGGWFWYSKNKATHAQLSLAELAGTYYTIILNFLPFTPNTPGIQMLLPLDLIVVGDFDTPKIKPPMISWACRYLLHNNHKRSSFYSKFNCWFPWILRVVGGADTPKIKSPNLSLV